MRVVEHGLAEWTDCHPLGRLSSAPQDYSGFVETADWVAGALAACALCGTDQLRSIHESAVATQQGHAAASGVYGRRRAGRWDGRGSFGLGESRAVRDSERQIELLGVIVVKNSTVPHCNTVGADKTIVQVCRAKGRKAVELIAPDAF